MCRLVESHEEVLFAVAWASIKNPVWDILERDSLRIKKAIIGTHFYQTHPDVLAHFQGSRNVRFVLQPTGVFHPKIYLFRSKGRWDALIGSANLTAGALHKNSEATLLIGSTSQGCEAIKAELEALIDRYWLAAKKLKMADVAAYREVWDRKQLDLRRVSGQYGDKSPTKVPTESDVMSMPWTRYLAAVKGDQTHGFEERCALLGKVQAAFAKYPHFSSMPLPTRKTIAGLPNKEDDRWGWFGSMKGAGYYHQAINNNDAQISRALDAIPLGGQVTRSQYDEYICEFVRAFASGRHGLAIATRLLAMKRPDQFVCLDSRNKQGLCKDFGIAQIGMDYDRYWEEIVERILDAPWWNVRRPSGAAGAVWNGRAAMLDAIFYEE